MNAKRNLNELIETYLNDETVIQYDRSIRKYRVKKALLNCSVISALAVCVTLISIVGFGKGNLFLIESHSLKGAETILSNFLREGPDVGESIYELINTSGKL